MKFTESYYDQLETYIKNNLDKVHLIRTHQVKGSAEAKTIAAKVAWFDVLVFLESNVECTTG